MVCSVDNKREHTFFFGQMAVKRDLAQMCPDYDNDNTVKCDFHHSITK